MGIAAARHRLFFVEKLSSVGQTWSVQFLESQLLQAGSDWHWVHLRLLSSFLQAEQACEQRDALSPLWMLACGGVFIAPGGGWPCSGSQPAERASEGHQLRSQQRGCVGSTLEEVLLHSPKVISW